MEVRKDWRVGVPRFIIPFVDPVKESYSAFTETHPKIKLTAGQYRSLFKLQNEMIQQATVNNTDGFMLPELLGHLQLVFLDEPSRGLVDRALYVTAGLKVKYRNDHSGGKPGNIRWSLNVTKYSPQIYRIWVFEPCKSFKTLASQNFKARPSFYKVKTRFRFKK